MTDNNAVSWLFLNCLKTEAHIVADVGALLAGSGLISRSYKDAVLPGELEIDTWETESHGIFPVQKYIYNGIFEKNHLPDKTYDIVFFLNGERFISPQIVNWSFFHGKKLIIREDILFSTFNGTELADYETELYEYNGSAYVTVNIWKVLRENIMNAFNEQKDADVLKWVEQGMYFTQEDIFILKIAIASAATLGKYEHMWKYVSQAYQLNPKDTELSSLYERLRH